MTGNDNEQMFLPVWRRGRLLFFTNIIAPGSTRIGYIAAAATEPQGTEVSRTGKAPVSAGQLAHCQKIANNGAGLQRFFDMLGGGNLEHFTKDIKELDLPFPPEGGQLIYICLYLDFLRKYAVDEEIVRLYEAAPAIARFDVERSVGIYKILAERLEPSRAEALIDADLKKHNNPRGQAMLVANLLRASAVVKFDLGKYAEAENLMLAAVERHETEDKWRRLADFSLAAGDRDKAVTYFLKAHEQSPLPATAAMRLARILVENGKMELARPFAETAAAVFGKPAEKLLEKIAGASQ